jgi:hypothetical protein
MNSSILDNAVITAASVDGNRAKILLRPTRLEQDESWTDWADGVIKGAKEKGISARSLETRRHCELTVFGESIVNAARAVADT